MKKVSNAVKEKEIFNIISSFKNTDDAAERYVVAALYLLFLKYDKTLDQIEDLNFPVGEIARSVGLTFGWGINTEISNFIKKYRINK